MLRLSEEELRDLCTRIADYVWDGNMSYAVVLLRKAIEPDPVQPKPYTPTDEKPSGWTDKWNV